MKHNTQTRTYITIRIHKHSNTNTQFTKLNTSILNINLIYGDKRWNEKNMKECDKPKSNINSKLHMIYVSSNNGRHFVFVCKTCYTFWGEERGLQGFGGGPDESRTLGRPSC